MDDAVPTAKSEKAKPKCFVIMPISDPEGYDPGHFRRVYEYIIKPACDKAGFVPLRADDIKSSNLIMLDILKAILECEMAVCDLSGRNPNVFFELGLRQAFNKPVALIKDNRTQRVFDIQGLRDLDYDNTLRIDMVQSAVNQLAQTITDTYARQPGQVNSLVDLLSIRPAALPEESSISPEGALLLSAMSDVTDRLVAVEKSVAAAKRLPEPFAGSSGSVNWTDLIQKKKRPPLEKAGVLSDSQKRALQARVNALKETTARDTTGEGTKE